jgi:hypothetical protein
VLQRRLRTASRRGLLLHSELNRDKRTEGSAEIAMGTRVPDPIDRYVGSRMRMRRLMLDMSQEKARQRTRDNFPAGAEIRKRD